MSKEERVPPGKGSDHERSTWWEWALIIPEFILTILAFFWESGSSEDN